MNRRVKRCASLAVVLAVMFGLPALGARQQTEREQVREVVADYLTAWLNGDHAAMYQDWSAGARRQLTEAQLHRAFTTEIKGDDPESRQARAAFGTDQIISGRPAEVISMRIISVAGGRATVDCVARFNFDSVMGFGFAPALPKLLAEANRNDPSGKSAYTLMLATPGAVEGDYTDTARGQTQDLIAGGPTGVAPYVTLHFHRFVLVKEAGEWRIANPVSVSTLPPPDLASAQPKKPKRETANRQRLHVASARKR